MLHLLGAGEQSSVQNLWGLDLFHDLAGLIDEALHRHATFATSGGVEPIKGLLQPLDLVFGFLEMLLERLAQLLGRGGLRHLRQRLHKLLLRVVEVTQLVQQKVLHALHRHCPALLA